MIAINLDCNGHLNLRPYYPRICKYYDDKFSDFITQQESPIQYKILKSKSLTAAFIGKYKLEVLVPFLLEGYTLVLENFVGLSSLSLNALRAYRYYYFKTLPLFILINSSSFLDLKNEQPSKVLVYKNEALVSLAIFESSLKANRLNRLLKDFSKKIIYRTENEIYFLGQLSQTASNLRIAEFERLGLKASICALDKNISVINLI